MFSKNSFAGIVKTWDCVVEGFICHSAENGSLFGCQFISTHVSLFFFFQSALLDTARNI